MIINGRVQGVFFRQKTKAEAEKLGLFGWVRNEDDGSVKIIAEGGEDKIKELIKWLRVGPRFAQVDEVKIKWQSAQNKFSQFNII
ncbi:MAG: acylphosphatase [Candidatus Berkelbacteria bacterium Licking1014_96]|uniref:Acylphosphatase n=1 Tax=Candidatus Berkelbacteria bacterium Licking1014_96 TaxID=2017149 RepID=A0A554LFV0_9BACT|nr:MAG: acylphosphatase [Candidatus Berkelbacteria bacterium Licking1014_96]